MTWLQTTNVDLRTLPPSESSMVRCCYCNRVVSPGEERCACPPHRGVSYEGKRFVYGIRSLFVRVELALAASLLLTLGGCAAAPVAEGADLLGGLLVANGWLICTWIVSKAMHDAKMGMAKRVARCFGVLRFRPFSRWWLPPAVTTALVILAACSH